MKKQGFTYSNVAAIILCGFMAVLPWISHLRFWKLSEGMQTIFNHSNGIYTELFIYYKEIAVILVGVVIIGFFLVGKFVFKEKIGEMPVFWHQNRLALGCVAVFVLAVIVSALFSEDKQTVLMGIPTEGEGVFALIGYMFLFLGAMNYFRTERDWKVLQYAMRILMVITIVLTCVEFFYQPMFEIPFFRNMLAGAEYRSLLESIENESFRNFVVLTFNNPNYFGGFCLLLLPFAMKDLVQSKNTVQRIGYSFCLAGLYFCVVAAKSTASFYLAIAEGILFFGLQLFLEKENRKPLFANMGVFAGSLAVVFLAVSALNGERLSTVSVSAVKNERYQELGIARYELSDIQIEENRLIFYIGEKVLTVSSENGSVRFFDTAGNPLNIQVLDGERGVLLTLEGQEFAGVTVEIIENIFAFDFGYENLVYFQVIDNSFYGIGRGGQLWDVVSLGNMSERFGAGIYGWITGRGYAWIHTLPILKETVLIGKGAGNFPLHFPQYDYVGLLNTHGTHTIVVDKPHCMYLQVAVDQGLVALLAILVLFAGGIIDYIKIRVKNDMDSERMGTADAAFVVLVTFAVYSSCNDSNVAVSPVFWIIFGIFRVTVRSSANHFLIC